MTKEEFEAIPVGAIRANLQDEYGRVVAPLTQAQLTAHGEIMTRLDRIIQLLEAIYENNSKA